MNTLKKLSLIMLIAASSNLFAQGQDTSPVVKKSKEAAFFKAAIGSALTATIFRLAGLRGILGALDYDHNIGRYKVVGHNRRELKVATMVASIEILVAFYGYRMAKNAFKDLEEIAQYESTGHC